MEEEGEHYRSKAKGGPNDRIYIQEGRAGHAKSTDLSPAAIYWLTSCVSEHSGYELMGRFG